MRDAGASALLSIWRHNAVIRCTEILACRHRWPGDSYACARWRALSGVSGTLFWRQWHAFADGEQQTDDLGRHRRWDRTWALSILTLEVRIMYIM